VARNHQGAIHWMEPQCQYPYPVWRLPSHGYTEDLRPRKSRPWTLPILIGKHLGRVRCTMMPYIKSRHQDGRQLVPLPKPLWNGSHQSVHTRTSKLDLKRVRLGPPDLHTWLSKSFTSRVPFLIRKGQQYLPYSSQ
jgi:hypothetical protein